MAGVTLADDIVVRYKRRRIIEYEQDGDGNSDYARSCVKNLLLGQGTVNILENHNADDGHSKWDTPPPVGFRGCRC